MSSAPHNYDEYDRRLEVLDPALLPALWMAVRALEDYAAGSRHMALRYGGPAEASCDGRLTEAARALEAADVLRTHAVQAQELLDDSRAAPPPLVQLRDARAAKRGSS